MKGGRSQRYGYHNIDYRPSINPIAARHSSTAVSSETSDFYLIDAYSQVGSQKVLQKVIALMDQAGVRHIILYDGDKLTSGDVANYSVQHPDRITASVRTKCRANKENKKGYYRRLKAELGSGRFGAISESLLYHARKCRTSMEDYQEAKKS